MEKGDQVKDCLGTGEMNIWTTAGIEKIALDGNDQLAITHPLVQISLLSILLENKTLTCRRRDWREGRKPKKGRNSKEKGQRGKSKNGTNVGGFPHISYIQVLVFWGWFNVLWVSACVSLSLREGKKE